MHKHATAVERIHVYGEYGKCPKILKTLFHTFFLPNFFFFFLHSCFFKYLVELQTV